VGEAAMEEREELEEENKLARVPFVLPSLYKIWIPGGKSAPPGCEPAIRLEAGCAGCCSGLPGEVAGARRACTGILFWPGFRCSPGTAPVHAPGWPVHRPAVPGISRKIVQDPSSMTLNYEEIVRRFQGLVQGNIDLKKCKSKLERYSMKIKLIVNQHQINSQLKKHMINNLKGCTSSNRRQDNCRGLLPLCLSANVMAPQR
jgi:hypothetical protein